MKKPSKIILTSALLLNVFVGGSHLYFSGQDIENKDSIPKGVEESSSNEVSVSSSEQSGGVEGRQESSLNSTVSGGSLGQPKEDASSISTVIDLPSELKSRSDDDFDLGYKLISKENSQSSDSLPNQDTVLDGDSSSYSQGSIDTADMTVNSSDSKAVSSQDISEVLDKITSEKGKPLVQEKSPVGIVSEKGTPLVQEESLELVISEKGESTTREELPSLVVSEKGGTFSTRGKPNFSNLREG